MWNKPVYEIVPETEIRGNALGDDIKGVGIGKCRELCDGTDECEAFVWQEVNKSGVCSLKKNSEGARGWNSQTTLYIKRGNHSYWLLWIFLILLGIILFTSYGKRRRS